MTSRVVADSVQSALGVTDQYEPPDPGAGLVDLAFQTTNTWPALVVAGGSQTLVTLPTVTLDVDQYLRITAVFNAQVTVADITVALSLDGATEAAWGGITSQYPSASFNFGFAADVRGQLVLDIVSTQPVVAGDYDISIIGNPQGGGAGGSWGAVFQSLVAISLKGYTSIPAAVFP